MRLILRAAGAMRAGPERELVDDYLGRADKLARGNGVLSVTEEAVDVSRASGREEETEKVLDVPPGAALFVLDERGKAMSSRELADTLARLRDDGVSAAVFAIGAADGFAPSAIPAGARRISFGRQTWPHKLVRVMLAEQLYRALSILAGSPYHRD